MQIIRNLKWWSKSTARPPARQTISIKNDPNYQNSIPRIWMLNFLWNPRIHSNKRIHWPKNPQIGFTIRFEIKGFVKMQTVWNGVQTRVSSSVICFSVRRAPHVR